MAPRRRRKERLPLTFKYCMIDKLARQRRNDDVRRRPPSADYNIVGSYNLQSERRQLFAGQAPRVSSSNIPVFHPDQLQMVSNNMIPQYHLHFPRTTRLHLDLNATPAANSSEDFVADFRGLESSLEVQSGSTHAEVVAVAPLSESDLELHLASTHREDVVACFGMNSVAVRNFVIQLHEEAASESSLQLQLAYSGREVPVSLELQLAYSPREVPVTRGVDISTVTAERNFVVQLHEAAGSEISLELQLASSQTHQELVVAADVDIHPVAAAAERNFLVQPHEVAGSESSLEAVQAASTHQEIVAVGIDRIFVVQLHEETGSESSLSAFQSTSDTHQKVVAARIDINTVTAGESNFVVELHEAAGSERSLEAFQAASDTHQEVVAARIDINTVTAGESNFVVELHEAAGSERSLEVFQSASDTHQEVVVAGIDINTVAAEETNFVVELHEAAGSERSLEAFQSASDTHQEVVVAGVDINIVAAEESNFVVELHEAAGLESSLEAFQSASATRQELVVAAGVDIHTVAAAAERNFVVTQLHEASREPKMSLMADLMNPAEEAPTTRVLESLEASLIYMNPEAASPHGHVDEPAEEEHEQQLLQAAAPVNLINSPAAHRLTHEPYHDTHELRHHDAHDIDTPGAPAAATGKKIVFKS